MRPLLMAFILFFFSTTTAVVGAQDEISVSASVNANEVTLDSSLNLTITIYGVQKAEPIALPEIDGFDGQYLGPSTRVSIVNGEYSSSIALNYLLYPLKLGEFEIPELSVDIKGQSFKTKPIKVKVVDSLSPPIPNTSNQSSTNPSQVQALKDRIFMKINLAKTQSYIQERVPVKIYLYVSQLSLQDIQYPDLEKIGFMMENYGPPRQYQQVINGIRYDIVEFNTALSPTRVGQLQIGPARIEANALVKSASRSPMQESIFNDDFFDRFFMNFERRPLNVSAEAVTLDVLPLPEENKPEDFNNAVGKFNFEVTAGPTQVKEGDPITIKMTLTGDGNLKSIQMPKYNDSPNFKTYEPSVKEDNGVKTLEQILIPQNAEIKQIPAIKFSYFDPDTKEYNIITRGPFDIQVSPSSYKSSTQSSMQPIRSQRSTEELGQDILFIKNDPGLMKSQGKSFWQSPWYWVGLVAFGIVWMLLVFYYRHTHRLAYDKAYAEQFLAPRYARQGLKETKNNLDKNDPASFCNSVYKTLQQYLSPKLQIPPGAIGFEQVQNHPWLKNADPKMINNLKQIFSDCDMVRFASGTLSQDQMTQTYHHLREIIDYLERHV